jgi:hypothetical protein
MQGIFMPVAEICHEQCENERSREQSIQKRVTILGCDLRFWIWTIVVTGFFAGLFWALGSECFAQASLPGTDASDKLEAAGTLLRILDTALFKWGARIFAGICIMSAAWSLKEQRFGIAIICVVGALIFGTAPTWVKNIFSIGAGDSIFGN